MYHGYSIEEKWLLVLSDILDPVDVGRRVTRDDRSWTRLNGGGQANVVHALVVDVPLVADDEPVHERETDEAAVHGTSAADPRDQHAHDEETQEGTLEYAPDAQRDLEDGAQVLNHEGHAHAKQANDHGDYLSERLVTLVLQFLFDVLSSALNKL